MNFRKNNQGFTLIEITVAIGIFGVIMLSATQIFRSVIEGQRNAIAAQNTQESMRYAMEVLSREIRQAKINPNDGITCSPATVAKSTYNSDSFGDSERLFFVNHYNECVQYYLNNGVLIRNTDGSIASATPDEIEISDLGFSIYDYSAGAPPGTKSQPRVTIKMKVNMRGGKAMHKNEFVIQTTLSDRYY